MQRALHALQRNPLAVLSACAVLGILVASHDSASELWWWLLIALATALSAFRKPNVWMLGAATSLTFGFIHLVCIGAARDHPIRAYLKPAERLSAVLHGRFVRAPMLRDDNPLQHQARFKVTSIELPTRGRNFVGGAEVRVWLTDPNFVAQGGEYRLTGTLGLVQRAWNPSSFDPEVNAINQGIVAEFTPIQSELMQPSFSLRLTLLKWAEVSREWIRRQLSHGIENDEMPRTLITTMALGTSETRSTEMREPFRRSGTLHVFAVSGLHVALLAAIGWMLLRPLGVERLRAIVILAPSLFVYAYLTGWVPSAARAALMSSVLLLAPLFGRDSRTLNSLGAAALILLATGTLQLFQPGFQLSFAVLGAIALGAGPLSRPFMRWAELDPFLPPRVASFAQRLGAGFRTRLVTTFATSLAATIGSLPFMIAHFRTCTPVAIIANALLVPLSEASLFLVTLSLIAGGAGLQFIQLLFNNANWLVAHLMMGSATFFASIPGGNFELPVPSLKPTPLTRLDVLSMPTGEGAQLLISDDQAWMLDCGSERSARRTILPLLRYERISQLDATILSHGDSGHVGGALTLADRFGGMQVFASVLEPSRFDARVTAMWQTSLQLDDMGRSLQHLVAGDQLRIGQARLHILHPRSDDAHDKGDDRAIVARIDCGKARILWCSDAGFLTEKAMLERLPPDELRSDILVRNHHDNDFSSLPEFLLAVSPKCLISSYTPANGDINDTARLRSRCDKLGIQLLDQKQTGFVGISVYPDHIDLEPWLQGEPVHIDTP